MNMKFDQVPVKKLARLVANIGSEFELLDSLRELEIQTASESGCIEFKFFQSLTDSRQFVLLEHFVSTEAFRSHLNQPHTVAFFKRKLVADTKVVDIESLAT